MEHSKSFYNKVFSTERMGRYFAAHPSNDVMAILHYQSNIELSGSFYACLSVFEVALRNSLNRELITLFGRDDWYKVISSTKGLNGLNYYINEAERHITTRGEIVTSPKIVAELTFGFWVSLMNSQYEKILWHDLRRAFRNRVFHNEPICWSKTYIDNMHKDILRVLGWIRIFQSG